MELGYNWFYRPRLDYELKRYEALAFEQYLDKCHGSGVLFPPQKELLLQINTIQSFLTEIKSDKFLVEKSLKAVSLVSEKIFHESVYDQSLLEVEKICNYLMKKIIPFKQKFEQLKNEAENSIRIHPIGILPIYKNEGWFLLENENKVDAYLFKRSFIIGDHCSVDYFRSFEFKNFQSTHEIKRKLMYAYSELPNPATYLIKYSQVFSTTHTIIPIIVEKTA